MDLCGSNDDEIQTVVNVVFQNTLVKKRRVSEIMLSMTLEDSHDESGKFLRDLRKGLDPHQKDAIVDDEEFYHVLKDLLNKYQRMDFISSNTSPIKCVTSDLSLSKHDSSNYSFSESDISPSSSPSAIAEAELIRLQDDYDNLRSHVKRLEETKNDLIKQLSLSEDKNAELENRCKELEEWKTNYDLANRFSFENNNWTSDAEANETRIKELESRITQLERELTSVRKQCGVLEDENLELLTVKNDLEEVQRHAEKLHKENEEYALYFKLKNQEIMDLKSECTKKEAVFNEKLVSLDEEYKTLLAAMQRNVELPISLESSFEEESNMEVPCLKDELGNSFSCLNTSVDSTSSGVQATTAEAGVLPANPEMKPVHICCPFTNERELQIAELRKLCMAQNAALAQNSNKTQSNKWKVFLAIVAYALHNVFFGYLVMCAFVFLLSPHLNYTSLVRSAPWFVSVSPGSSNPSPV